MLVVISILVARCRQIMLQMTRQDELQDMQPASLMKICPLIYKCINQIILKILTDQLPFQSTSPLKDYEMIRPMFAFRDFARCCLLCILCTYLRVSYVTGGNTQQITFVSHSDRIHVVKRTL